jgi:hypothetical protein
MGKYYPQDQQTIDPGNITPGTYGCFFGCFLFGLSPINLVSIWSGLQKGLVEGEVFVSLGLGGEMGDIVVAGILGKLHGQGIV